MVHFVYRYIKDLCHKILTSQWQLQIIRQVTFTVEWQPMEIVLLTCKEGRWPRVKMIFPPRKVAVAAIIKIRKRSILLWLSKDTTRFSKSLLPNTSYIACPSLYTLSPSIIRMKRSHLLGNNRLLKIRMTRNWREKSLRGLRSTELYMG